MDLLIDAAGEVRCIYGEAISLTSLGAITIQRASHVEPDELGRWWADLSPAEGPVLGPFDRRSEALNAEARWLLDHRLMSSPLPCSPDVPLVPHTPSVTRSV